MKTPLKKGKVKACISEILELCSSEENGHYYNLEKSKVKLLEKFNIPNIEQLQFRGQDPDWKLLSNEMEEFVYCVWVISAGKGDERESMRIVPLEIKKLLEEKSEKTVIGLALLAHSLRLSNWITANFVLNEFHHIEIVEMNEQLSDLVKKSCTLLSEPRVVDVFTVISGLNANRVQKILREKDFRIRIVKAFLPMKGWITPIEIVLNLQVMTQVEQKKEIAFARLLGHELTHHFCRLNSNFGFSTPEKLKSNGKSSPFSKFVENIKQVHPQISNHIESGLIFELGFLGAKLKFTSEDLCNMLEEKFLNKSSLLPIIKLDQEKHMAHFTQYEFASFNEQFGFYPADLNFDAM
jgi:hypothetical protein